MGGGRPELTLGHLVLDILIVWEPGGERGRGPGEHGRVELGGVGLVGGRGGLIIADSRLVNKGISLLC